MPLARLPIDELRSLCKHRIESLELWLRRLIHDKLLAAFGSDYFTQSYNGNYIFGTAARRHAETRLQQNPARYAKHLDALQLDHLVGILCKEDLFSAYFTAALGRAFPDGRMEAKTFLDRLVDIRNPLSHVNPISVRQALRVFCYSEDIITSIQEHYIDMGTSDEFNAPNFVTFRDSMGNSRSINKTQDNLDLTDTRLYAGDEIRLEVDVDETSGSSTVKWAVGNMPNGETGTGSSFSLILTPRHVNKTFAIGVSLVSAKEWHRHGNYDAYLWLTYKVLPPP